MGDLELVGPVVPPRPRPGQVQELFRRGDEYFCVSTVPDVGDRTGLDLLHNATIDLVGALGGYATDGEETMAFPADAGGNWLSCDEVAVANGPGSRDAVLEQLRTLPPQVSAVSPARRGAR